MIDEILLLVPDAKIEHLAYGDYQVIGPKHRIVIERKEINDLFHSLEDGRLWDQMKGIEKFDGYKRVLLIEGSFERAKKWRPNLSLARFTGTKVSILYGWDGITITTTEDQKETIDFLRRLNEKVGDGGEEQYARSLGFTKDLRTADEESIDVLRGFDGIGEMKAAELLREFRTVEKVARARPTELAKVLTRAEAEHVHDSFRHDFSLRKKKAAPRAKPYKAPKPAATEQPEVKNETS